MFKPKNQIKSVETEVKPVTVKQVITEEKQLNAPIDDEFVVVDNNICASEKPAEQQSQSDTNKLINSLKNTKVNEQELIALILGNNGLKLWVRGIFETLNEYSIDYPKQFTRKKLHDTGTELLKVLVEKSKSQQVSLQLYKEECKKIKDCVGSLEVLRNLLYPDTFNNAVYVDLRDKLWKGLKTLKIKLPTRVHPDALDKLLLTLHARVCVNVLGDDSNEDKQIAECNHLIQELKNMV